jgi:hypothetical protein
MDKTFSLIEWIVKSSPDSVKKAFMAGLMIIFAFPLITTTVLWADRTGYFTNIYQEQHKRIAAATAEALRMWQQTQAGLQQNQAQLIINHGLIRDGNYYLQRTCVNTANTREEREKCLQHAPSN